MPKFELKPVDGGNIVHLPEGETVLGRGPLFGVNDKRVSRHHGVLENVDGVLRIKPTHLNPCFIQSSLEAAPQPLKRDQWHTLGPGDLFSLLPEKYIYRVQALEETVEKEKEAEDEGTLRNSQNLDDENGRQNDGEKVVLEEAKTSCSTLPSANEEPEQSTSSDHDGPSASLQSTLVVSLDSRRSVERPPSSPTGDLVLGGGGETSAPQQRKRTLPAWMMTASAGEVKTPSTSKGAGKRGLAKGAAATTTPKPKPKASSQATATATQILATPKRARTRVLSSEDEDEAAAAVEVPEEEEEEEVVVQVAKRRRKRRKSSEEDDEVKKAAALPAQAVRPSRRAAPALGEMSEESDSMEVEQAMDKDEEEEEEEEEEKQQVEVKRQTGRAPGSSSLSSGDAEGSGSSKRNGNKLSPQNGHRASQSASTAAAAGAGGGAAGGSGRKGTKRTPCPYGSSCYRKNPIHFQECSHPGDSDYEEEAEEEGDEENDDRPECPYGTDCYRTNPLHKKEYKHTRPPARTSARASRRDRDDEDEEEDAYDDSFINDDSEEDVDEDSDYVPDDSGDSGKEDVRRLQKEAKAFLRRKK